MEKICMKNTQVSFRDCLKKQTKKRIEAASTKRQASSLTIVRNGIIKDVERRKYANNKK